MLNDNGGNALQFFASNPRSIQLANIEKFKKESERILEYCEENNFKLVLHSAYTINLAKELKNGTRDCDIKDCYWIKILINEIAVSDILGAIGTIVHVGKYTYLTPEEGLANMKKALKYIINIMMESGSSSKIILETPAGQGTELLNNLTDFLEFYNSFTKEERKYFKICVDTAHLWSAGYELEDAFDIILKKNAKDIAVIHFNNSEKNKGSFVDVHASIFDGKINKKSLYNIIDMLKNHKANPMIILETPSDNYKKEINWIKEI